MYTCTAYNSYGTMGQSEPTQVILQVRLLSLTLKSQHQLQRKPFPVSIHSYTWAQVKRLPTSSRTHHHSGCLLGLSISRRWAES